jgi:hypothetical protein
VILPQPQQQQLYSEQLSPQQQQLSPEQLFLKQDYGPLQRLFSLFGHLD